MKRFLQNLTTPASALAHERTSRFALPTGCLRPKTDVLQRGSTSAKRRRRTLSAKIDVNSLKFLPKNTECLRSSVVRPSAILQLEPDPERRCKALPRQMIVSLLVILAMHWCSLESASAVATQSVGVRDRTDRGGDEYSITPKKLRSIVTYIKHTGIQVVTLQEGIRLMNPERNNPECQR